MTSIDVATIDAKPANKRERQRLETRARLLDRALQLFAARGFEGTSLRDVAAEAGVNHGMIKYHFDSKDQLWRAAVTLLFERMDAELGGHHPEDEGASPLDQTKNAVRRYVRYCARHPEHARIMVQESIRDNDRLAWAVDRFIRPQHRAARANRERRGAEGIWPDIPEASLAYMLVASAQMPFVLAPELKHLYGVDMLDDAHVEAHADALVTLFFAHRAAGNDDIDNPIG